MTTQVKEIASKLYGVFRDSTNFFQLIMDACNRRNSCSSFGSSARLLRTRKEFMDLYAEHNIITLANKNLTIGELKNISGIGNAHSKRIFVDLCSWYLNESEALKLLFSYKFNGHTIQPISLSNYISTDELGNLLKKSQNPDVLFFQKASSDLAYLAGNPTKLSKFNPFFLASNFELDINYIRDFHRNYMIDSLDVPYSLMTRKGVSSEKLEEMRSESSGESGSKTKLLTQFYNYLVTINHIVKHQQFYTSYLEKKSKKLYQSISNNGELTFFDGLQMTTIPEDSLSHYQYDGETFSLIFLPDKVSGLSKINIHLP